MVLSRTLTGGRGGRIPKRGAAAVAVGAGVIWALAVGGTTRRFAIVDDSMRPQFEPGDWVIAVRRCGVPRRGDVVIFTHPSQPGRFLIKRTIGLPGERVSAADGQIHINGRLLADPWGDRPIGTVFDIRIPTGTVWVIGDNRSGASVDSRVLDAIPLDEVGWKVVARYWPPLRAGRIGT